MKRYDGGNQTSGDTGDCGAVSVARIWAEGAAGGEKALLYGGIEGNGAEASAWQESGEKSGLLTYYCGEEKAAAAERAEALDGLYETLCIIGREERFAASGMQEERTETGIRFTAEYEYHVMLTEETTERMERLKYNGKEAVGYEEKGNIQQRAAE